MAVETHSRTMLTETEIAEKQARHAQALAEQEAKIKNIFDGFATAEARKSHAWQEARMHHTSVEEVVKPTPAISNASISRNIQAAWESVIRELDDETFEKNKYREIIVRQLLLEDGTLIPTIPDLRNDLYGTWRRSTYGSLQEAIPLRLDIARESDHVFGVRLTSPSEHPQTQLRLSGHLHAKEQGNTARMMYIRDNTFIHPSVELQQRQSLTQLVASVRYGDQYILE